MKVLFIFVVSAIALTEAGRLRQNSPKLMVYEIRERDDGNGPDVQMLKVPGDTLYKTISSLQEPAEEEEDSGVDVQKLLTALLNKPKVNKKRERQRNMVQMLKKLVKKLEKEYELEDIIQANDKSSVDDNDESANYFLLPQGLQKVQARPEKQENPLVSLPLQLALRSRVDDEDRDDERSFGDFRTMPPPGPSGKYDKDYE